MPNHGSIRRVLMVAASSGYVWGLRFPYSIAAYGYLRFYLPATAWGLGYSPGRAVGMGEDLPAGVARQWSRWCLRPGYVANEFGRGVTRHYYDEFRAPILSLYASDDSIATVRNVEDLLRLFPSAPKQIGLFGAEPVQRPKLRAHRFLPRQPGRGVASCARLVARGQEPAAHGRLIKNRASFLPLILEDDVAGRLTVLVVDPLRSQRVFVDERVGDAVHVHVVGRFHVAAPHELERDVFPLDLVSAPSFQADCPPRSNA